MRRTTDDVDGTADTERPAALGVWRCDGEGAEPTEFSSLLEATNEPPRTPDAQVYGGGAMLAQSAEDVAQWTFTDIGMERLEGDMRGAIDRDYDAFIGIVLAEDLKAVGQ